MRWIPRLVRLGVDPDARDSLGEDVLCIAAASGYTQELALLLRHRRRPLLRDRAGSALVRALLHGHEDAYRELRRAGAPVDFWAGLLLGDRALVEAALARDPSQLELREHPELRASPLAFALRGRHVDLANWLLDQGADPTAPTFHSFLVRDGLNARADYAFFENAVKRGGRQVADARDGDGFSALHQAAAAGRRDLVELLLRHGADKNARTERGQSVLDSASTREIRELLMSRGAR